jgi:carnitine O-acetyltransferase
MLLLQLPVNSLVETAGKWLETVRFCTTDPSPTAMHAGPTPEFLECQRLAEDFVSSPVTRELQKRLLARAEKEDNWISEWWNHLAYFSVRTSHLGGVCARSDGWARRPIMQRQLFLLPCRRQEAAYACPQSGWTHQSFAFLPKNGRDVSDFRCSLDCVVTVSRSGVLEPEMVRTTPLAMSSYEYLFNACRYPGKEVDTSKKFDANSHNHIVVMRHGRFYEVSIVSEAGEYLSQADLEACVPKFIPSQGSFRLQPIQQNPARRWL